MGDLASVHRHGDDLACPRPQDQFAGSTNSGCPRCAERQESDPSNDDEGSEIHADVDDRRSTGRSPPQLTDADYQAWLDVARKSAYAKFAKDVPNGQKLIDEALAVK